MTTTGHGDLHRLGIKHAAKHMECCGWAIVGRSDVDELGDVDLIAREDTRIVFCQIAARTAGTPPRRGEQPLADGRAMRRSALAWLLENNHQSLVPELRFDAIGVTVDSSGGLVSLEHLEGAL